MDALSEVLRVIRLDSAIFFHAEFSESWCVASPPSAELAPALLTRPAHLIIYHLLCEGQAFVELADGQRVALTAGDLVTFPHGHRHRLGAGRDVPPLDGGEAVINVRRKGLDVLETGGGGARSRFICGYLACDPQLGRAFLGGLPAFVKVNIREDPSGQWLENSLRFSVTQASARQAGSDALLAKLSEALFAETVRRYARQLPDEQTGWLSGVRDPELGAAMSLIHQRPAHPWTSADLAREAGVSRTVLTERFRHFLGESPMAYLTRWRLVLAARSLATTSRSVAQVALEVGYESEAAFNRAFKREHGVPPAKYRRETLAGVRS